MHGNMQRSVNTTRSETDYIRGTYVGRDSSVGTAIRYGLDGSGDRTPKRARFSAPAQAGHRAHPAPVQTVPRLFPAGKKAGAWR
jgi:hypothetical protein